MKYHISHRQLVSGMFPAEIYAVLDKSLWETLHDNLNSYYYYGDDKFSKTTDALNQVECYEVLY